MVRGRQFAIAKICKTSNTEVLLRYFSAAGVDDTHRGYGPEICVTMSFTCFLSDYVCVTLEVLG